MKRASPVRTAVRIIYSPARFTFVSAAACFAWSFFTMPDTSAYGAAGWWRFARFTFGNNSFKCPFQRAGFSPERNPFAFAASSTRSIRPRSSRAVRGLDVHQGFKTSNTSSVVMCFKLFGRSVAHRFTRSRFQSVTLFLFLKPDLIDSRSASANVPKVPSPVARSAFFCASGSMPRRNPALSSPARSRASSRLTPPCPAEPRPRSRCLPVPRSRYRKIQERLPLSRTDR